MPGHLAARLAVKRLVAERQAVERDLRGDVAADVGRQFRVVVAADPDPFAAALQRCEPRAVGLRQPGVAAAIVEAVAERYDARGSRFSISAARRTSVAAVS